MANTKGYPEALEKKLHDQRFYREDSNPEFTKNVKAISRTIAHMLLPVWYLHRLLPVCSPQHLPHPQVHEESGSRARE